MKPTIALYGIDPKELKLLTYQEALHIKLDACKNEIKIAANRLDEFYNTGKAYDGVSQLNARLKELRKAEAHLTFLLDELD